MRVLTLMLAGTALCVSACKRSDNADATANDTMMTDNGGVAANDLGTAPATPAALPATAQDFVNAAAASDKFEIDSSKLALASGSSAAVKAFANQMVSAHTASTAKLKSTIAGMTPALTPNDAPNADQQAALASLQGKTGADLDAAYAAAQVDAHQKTLDALNHYAANGDNAKLQAFAKDMIPKVTAHLNSAKALK